MSAGIRVARDSHGIRIELEDQSDTVALDALGPFKITDHGTHITVTPGEGDLTSCYIGNERHGLRSHTANPEEFTEGRFGPWEIEVDLYADEGFTIELPPIHELPWPDLRLNEKFCYKTQLAIAIAERVKAKAQAVGEFPAKVMRTMFIPGWVRSNMSPELYKMVQRRLG